MYSENNVLNRKVSIKKNLIYPERVKRTIFIFVNTFSLFDYMLFIERVVYIKKHKNSFSSLNPDLFTVLLMSLGVCILIRCFALYISKDLKDYYLRRIIHPFNFLANLRLLAIFIICETFLFGSYVLYILSYLNNLNDKNVIELAIIVGLSHFLNLLNLIVLNSIHPDLFGIKFTTKIRDSYGDKENIDNEVVSSVLYTDN